MTTPTIATSPRRGASARSAYGLLAVSLLTAAVFEAIKHGTGWGQLALFGVGPDLALLPGVGRGLAKGQLHPRAVGLYNLVHRYWAPTALAVIVALGLIPLGFLVGALAWASHISFDRALGYGLRTRDGFQRP